MRQYDLVSRASLAGRAAPIRVIDADLGVAGRRLAAQAVFTDLTEQIALGQVGVVLALARSPGSARSSAEWYRLLDRLCGMHRSRLIADEASVYHPGMFDDRLLLGLKRTMAEAELQVLRARMLGGLRNKAARGELRIPLPAGLVHGEAPGQILLHPDEAVRARASPQCSTGSQRPGRPGRCGCGSRENGLKLPSLRDGQLAWVTAAYPAVHKILTHPAYAGAYVYGRTRAERYIDASGTPAGTAAGGAPAGRLAGPDHRASSRLHRLGHLPGQHRPAWPANMAPVRGADGTGATREGCALLQGLAICGICGRRLGVFYRGPAKSIPGYQCNGGVLVGGGQGRFCTRVSGLRTDPAVAQHVLEVLTPLALQAAIDAADQIEASHDAALDRGAAAGRAGPLRRHQGRAPLPRRRPREPAGRPRPGDRVAKPRCKPPRMPNAELDRRAASRPVRLSADERAKILAIATDLPAWAAPSTTDRDRKELLTPCDTGHHRRHRQPHRPPRAALERRADQRVSVDLPKPRPPYRTSEDTVSLIAAAVHSTTR